MKPREIEMHIEEFVLHGFPTSERYCVADAMQTELARLLTEEGLFITKDRAREQLDAGTIRLNLNANRQATGTQIGRAIFDGMRDSLFAASRAVPEGLPPIVREVLSSRGLL